MPKISAPTPPVNNPSDVSNCKIHIKHIVSRYIESIEVMYAYVIFLIDRHNNVLNKWHLHASALSMIPGLSKIDSSKKIEQK